MSDDAEPIVLAEGRLGPVLALVDQDTGAAYALKVLPDRIGTADRRRLAAEIRHLSVLRGRPEVVVPDRVDRLPDGRWAVRVELCTQSLPELLTESGPLSAAEAAEIGVALADALAAAHAAGLVHGAVHPGNVLFRPGGEPVLTDFGTVLRPGPTVRREDDLRGLGTVLELIGSRTGPLAELAADLHGEQPPTAAEAARRLRAMRSARPPAVPVSGPIVEFAPQDRNSRRRRRAGWGVALLLLAGVAVAATWAARRPDPAEPARPPAPRPAAASSPETAWLRLAEPVDRGDVVELAWQGSPDLLVIVVVTGERAEPRRVVAGRVNHFQLPVEPDGGYCFALLATDGGEPIRAGPRPIRGAACPR
ncbi:protein kinase domain-containing protein [Mangrovihabitans endophyticus]|uniref:protein kinase domain-containing protein n=1 Tax=Mangrovihabitans endophyticus TaxID=1751298 RepID=UPI0027BAB964|nr:hypothetical protein [Mangrovihabitans endophyticus]